MEKIDILRQFGFSERLIAEIQKSDDESRNVTVAVSTESENINYNSPDATELVIDEIGSNQTLIINTV